MIILPVDRGFEHGPTRSFAPNPPAYDPPFIEESGMAWLHTNLHPLAFYTQSFTSPCSLLDQRNALRKKLEKAISDLVLLANKSPNRNHSKEAPLVFGVSFTRLWGRG